MAILKFSDGSQVVASKLRYLTSRLDVWVHVGSQFHFLKNIHLYFAIKSNVLMCMYRCH